MGTVACESEHEAFGQSDSYSDAPMGVAFVEGF